MNHSLIWRSALASNLLALQNLLLPRAAGTHLHLVPILQGTLLIAGLTLFLFGILLVLIPLRRLPSMGTLSLGKVATGGLFCLFLAALGAVGAGIQALIAALAGSGSVTLLLAGMLSSVVVGVLGLIGQAVMRFSAGQILLLGAVLILIGILTALIQIALLLLPAIA